MRGFCAGLDCVYGPCPGDPGLPGGLFRPAAYPVRTSLTGWRAGSGLSLDQNWPEEQQRALVLEAGELYRWQGTVRGIIEHVRLYTGYRTRSPRLGRGGLVDDAGQRTARGTRSRS